MVPCDREPGGGDEGKFSPTPGGTLYPDEKVRGTHTHTHTHVWCSVTADGAAVCDGACV